MLASSVAAGRAAHPEPALLRLANLTTAPESARVGFAFDLDGPPLVDELPAGALTTLLPGRAELGELWVLPRGLTLPKSLPEPLPIFLPGQGSRSPLLPGGAAQGIATGLPGGLVTLFLIDRPNPRPGPRGDLLRQLVTGLPAPAEGAQLRVLNLVGAAPGLDVCLDGADSAPIARAVPAWGLSRFGPWSPPTAAAGRGAAVLTLRVAAEPTCRGQKLGTVSLRLAEHGAWTLIAMTTALPMPTALPIDDRGAGALTLRALLLDEGSLLPERAVALPVLPAPGRP